MVGVEYWGRKEKQLSGEENWEENKIGKKREENRGRKRRTFLLGTISGSICENNSLTRCLTIFPVWKGLDEFSDHHMITIVLSLRDDTLERDFPMPTISAYLKRHRPVCSKMGNRLVRGTGFDTHVGSEVGSLISTKPILGAS
ncbi:hypothetical protein LXL04_021218 [Taraxacum kok-saghyz]